MGKFRHEVTESCNINHICVLAAEEEDAVQQVQRVMMTSREKVCRYMVELLPQESTGKIWRIGECYR